MSETQQRVAAAPGRSIADLRGVGKQVVAATDGGTVKAFFEKNIAAVASILPRAMTAERMTKVALNCLRTTPMLRQCTLDSLMGAIVKCMQLGLEPNGPLGHVYLIPFKRSKKLPNGNWEEIYEVQFITGYKGLIELSTRSDKIVNFTTRLVYAGDNFDVSYGTNESISHKPMLDGDAGEWIGVYCVVTFKDGPPMFEYMSKQQVFRIRDSSEGYRSALRAKAKNPTAPAWLKAPWVANEEAMARKTVIRRISNYVPMSVELAEVLSLEGRADSGKMQGLETVLEYGDFVPVAEIETDAEPEANVKQVAADTGTATTVVAERVDEGEKVGEPVKRRGRPPGSTNKPREVEPGDAPASTAQADAEAALAAAIEVRQEAAVNEPREKVDARREAEIYDGEDGNGHLRDDRPIDDDRSVGQDIPPDDDDGFGGVE